jgi:hypothetical protein
MLFPGQRLQLETGLHYKWYRQHYSTTGRYLQQDPLIVDDGAASVKGLPVILIETTSSVGKGAVIAGSMGIPRASARALLPDGLSVYGYARQSTVASVKNCARMSRLRAPMAIRRPISWVRSVTADRGTAKIDPKMKADRFILGPVYGACERRLPRSSSAHVSVRQVRPYEMERIRVWMEMSYLVPKRLDSSRNVFHASRSLHTPRR